MKGREEVGVVASILLVILLSEAVTGLKRVQRCVDLHVHSIYVCDEVTILHFLGVQKGEEKVH